MNSEPKCRLAAAKDRIVFILGKPVRKHSLFTELFQLLQDQGREVLTHLPHETKAPVPPWLQKNDFVVHRGLFLNVLAALQPMEQAGLRFCNNIAATMAINNRFVLRQRLHLADLPTPPWQIKENWEEVRALAKEKSIVVKAENGFIGRGAGVFSFNPDVHTSPEPPFPGPYLVEEQIAHDGWDRKLYICGSKCRGLLKKWPRNATEPDQLFTPEPLLADLAKSAGQMLGLEIYGVDFILGKNGPLIVDVNAFPGFKGISDAASLIADYICAMP